MKREGRRAPGSCAKALGKRALVHLLGLSESFVAKPETPLKSFLEPAGAGQVRAGRGGRKTRSELPRDQTCGTLN